MIQMTDEQKKLADQMAKDIQEEIKIEVKNMEHKGSSEVFLPKPNALVDGILEWGKQLDLDEIKQNAVLMVKVNSEDPEYAYKFQMGVVKHVLEPRFASLKAKKITVLFISEKDDITVLTEEDMAKAGWVKKEPSRIIIP
jgi:hypothetical protein